MDKDQLKKQAADYAIDNYIQSGMVVGLGAGSTSLKGVQRLAERLACGDLKDIVGIPAAKVIAEEARRLNIPLSTLDEHPVIDLTFDGADEVDPHLNLIKGGGGALLREKIVAQASQQEIIIVDESKQVPVLGTHWAVPIEVIPFGLGSHKHFLESIGGQPQLRLDKDNQPYLTDQGNYILDTHFGEIHDPETLAMQLNNRAGIVEHGLFLGLATQLIVATAEGIRLIAP